MATAGKRKGPKQRPKGGHLVDGWSALHFAAGALFGLAGVPWHSMLALAVSWEAIEAEFRRRSKGAGGLFEPESWQNMVSDVVVDMLGWAAGGALAMWLFGRELGAFG